MHDLVAEAILPWNFGALNKMVSLQGFEDSIHRTSWEVKAPRNLLYRAKRLGFGELVQDIYGSIHYLNHSAPHKTKNDTAAKPPLQGFKRTDA